MKKVNTTRTSDVMHQSKSVSLSHEIKSKSLHLREPHIVMQPERLGAMHQTRLSFVRTLLRKITHENWQLTKHTWALSDEGYGHAIYRLDTHNAIYHLVIFCNKLSDNERIDRVIAQKWDVTFGLVYGEVSEELLADLKQNIPLQEAGRNSNMVMVLARANKSVRVFDHIVNSLAKGEQPNPNELAKVGYILRTTAVYGNGKFGIYDFKPLEESKDFGQSFSAQMCAVYILKQFSLDWVDFLAKKQGGDNATTLNIKLKRYLGVGNATGLGMAPFLISHPCIVDQWMTTREKALATVLDNTVTQDKLLQLIQLLKRAVRHLDEVVTVNEHQKYLNTTSVNELRVLVAEVGPDDDETDIEQSSQHFPQAEHTLSAEVLKSKIWRDIYDHSCKYSFETQEVLISCLMELYPDQVDVFENDMNADETMGYPKGSLVSELLEILRMRYQWAINIDFGQPDNKYWFWYRSEDKEEPRLGIRGSDIGDEQELPLDIARQVKQLYEALKDADKNQTLASYLLKNPVYRSIVRRVWTLGHKPMGDIQMNTIQKEALPMHLLRCKLSMFGATKFDPRSDRWVRVCLFQGAPLFNEVHDGEWIFPLLPSLEALSGESNDSLSQ